MADVIAERDGFEPVVIKGADDVDRDRDRARRSVAARGARSSRPRSATIPRTPAIYHNNFQDPEKFLQAGGRRGRQLQMLVEGTYYINRLFATVEMVPKTIVEVGNVGVVVSYTGELGVDLSGDQYKHGELVRQAHARRVERAAAAGQVRFQHLRRQGARRADHQLHPEVEPRGPARTSSTRTCPKCR